MSIEPGARRAVALARFLRQHHSAISVAELHQLGYSASAIRHLTQRETLLRVERGAYRSGLASPTADTFLRCQLLAVGPDAALGRASAAHHLGYLDFAPRTTQIVVQRHGPRTRRRSMTVHRSPTLVEQQVVVVNGLRCTNTLRTILDLAAVTRTGPDYKLLRRALRQATTKDKGLPVRLGSELALRRGSPGAGVLATVLDEHLESTSTLRSDLEAAFLDLCLAARLPLPETNAIVEGHEVDAVWRAARVVVELDTYRYHGDVRAFERDRARDADLSVAGYRLIRITGRRLERERAKIVRQLRALLHA